ncbi:MAG: PCMD domain-containing protein [Bacteroidota bacterium]|nr:PCMD domain-containing protein [Bacteroidota bacterium]
MMKSLHIIFALLTINGTLSQQLENSGFEQWENVGTGEEEPLSWSSTKTSDNSSLNGLAPQVISRSTDAHTGTYAAKLVNKNVPFVNIVANGILTNGIIHTTTNPQDSYVYTDVNSSDHSQPFTSFPDSIVGWYKYAPQGNDVGNIQVLLHGSYGQLPVDASTSIIALAEFDFSANSNWTRFSTPFIYYPTINNPAYILCNISAGDSTQAVANSELKIDDLELIYNTTKIPNQSTNSINVTYLNDHLQFSNVVKEINYAIYNLQGQLMNIGKIDRYNRNVSITLEIGIYFISIQSKDHHQSIKILVD